MYGIYANMTGVYKWRMLPYMAYIRILWVIKPSNHVDLIPCGPTMPHLSPPGRSCHGSSSRDQEHLEVVTSRQGWLWLAPWMPNCLGTYRWNPMGPMQVTIYTTCNKKGHRKKYEQCMNTMQQCEWLLMDIDAGN